MTRLELYCALDRGCTSPAVVAQVQMGLSIVIDALSDDKVGLAGVLLTGAVAAADAVGIDPVDAIEVLEELLEAGGAR